MFPPDRVSLAERYVALLAGDGVVRGLIGPREAPRLWERHVLNCAVLAQVLPQGGTVCDVGSGAGLPGLVLAIARPDLQLALVEPLLRRTTFLSEACSALGLDNVEVVRARADALHGLRTFDVVTSRAVAPLPRLLEWSMPLVAPTGSLLAMKGSSARAEVEEAGAALRRWGCAPAEVLTLGDRLLSETTFAVRVSWADPGRVSWPRGGRGPSPKGATGDRRGGRGQRPGRDRSGRGGRG